MNDNIPKELSNQFKAIWTLEGIWRRYNNSGVVAIPTTDGMEFIDMSQCYPAEAVKYLHDQFKASYEVVSCWCNNIDVENALV